jgi:uncharacterized protein (TIGR03437 family)
MINGAPIQDVQNEAILFEVPVDLSGASAMIQVVIGSLQSNIVTVPVAPIAPSLSSQISDLSVRAPGSGIVSMSNPAQAGDLAEVSGTGFGLTNPPSVSGIISSAAAGIVAPVAVTVGGRAAVVVAAASYAYSIGVDYVQFTIPAGLPGGTSLVVVTVGGMIASPVTLFLAPTRPGIGGVTGVGAVSGMAQSGSWVSIYGQNLSATTRSWNAADFSGNSLPTTLDGVTVTINGKVASVYYVSPVQLNVQAPADSSFGAVQV